MSHEKHNVRIRQVRFSMYDYCVYIFVQSDETCKENV